MERERPIVVTGASGFIGKHIVKALLHEGFSVRGSVRSEVKAEETRKAVGSQYTDKLDFVFLDLTKDDGWKEALSGAGALLHTASPFPMGNPKDPQELITPAVEGTLRALRAAQAAKVNRVVVTSSMVAVYNDELRSDQQVFDETNWSDADCPTATPYEMSKTLAEKAAWEFVEKEAPELQLSTVNPGVVFGAPLDTEYGTSLQLIERLLAGKDPMLPRLHLPVVDVLDVAKMHILSLENEAASNERFIAVSETLWISEVAQILKEEFVIAKTKTRVAPDFLVKVMSKVMPELRAVVPRLGKDASSTNEKAVSQLGIDFIPARQAIINAAQFVLG